MILLRWWLHLAGWTVLTVPIVLVAGPWAAPLGPVGFELVLAVLVLRIGRVRPVPPHGGGRDDDDGSAGVREPRRPVPMSGAGAIHLPS